MKNLLLTFVALSALLMAMSAPLLTSCNSGEEYLPESEMEEILYDLHLAQAMVQQMPTDSVDYYSALYKASLLKKYNLTEEKLQRNLVYYSTDGAALASIYSRLAERTRDSENLSVEPSLVFQTDGDTINLWSGPSTLLFCNHGRNEYSFVLETDTLVRPGDRIVWRSTSSAIYSEGERNAYASISMEYTDTTAHIIRQIGGYGLQTYEVTTHDPRKLQRINLTLHQNTSWSNDIKLLTISNIYLLRIRSVSASAKVDTTTVKQDSIPAEIDNILN